MRCLEDRLTNLQHSRLQKEKGRAVQFRIARPFLPVVDLGDVQIDGHGFGDPAGRSGNGRSARCRMVSVARATCQNHEDEHRTGQAEPSSEPSGHRNHEQHTDSENHEGYLPY